MSETQPLTRNGPRLRKAGPSLITCSSRAPSWPLRGMANKVRANRIVMIGFIEWHSLSVAVVEIVDMVDTVDMVDMVDIVDIVDVGLWSTVSTMSTVSTVDY